MLSVLAPVVDDNGEVTSMPHTTTTPPTFVLFAIGGGLLFILGGILTTMSSNARIALLATAVAFLALGVYTLTVINKANLLGEEGKGFQMQMMQFQDERLVACVSTIAGSEQLWEETRSWCQERVLFGKPLSKMQNTQFKLAELATEVEVGQAFVDRLCVGHVRGDDLGRGVRIERIVCLLKNIGFNYFQIVTFKLICWIYRV